MVLITSGVSAETITMENADQDVNGTVQKEWIGATNNAALAAFNIIDYYPTTAPRLTIGESQEFHVSTNQECNIEWYFNDQLLQTNFSVLSANFTLDANTSSQYTLYNVKANASNSNGTYHIIWEFGVSSKTLHLGQTWELKDGYNLTLVEVGASGNKALLNLEKNGILLDQHIVSADSQYYYNRSFNGTDKVIISAYISDVFKGQISSLIQFKSIEQYSDVGTLDTNPTKLLKVGDTWDLENNCSLKFADVEKSGTYCVLFLDKNGTTVDKRIIDDNSVYEYQRKNESTNDTESILEILVLNTLSFTSGGYAEFLSDYSIKSDANTVDIDPFVLVRSGEYWDLNDGYNITVDETFSNKRALITLKKGNVIVDRDVIEEDSTYYYNRLNLSDNTTHLILDINSSKIFNGIYNDYVQFYSEYLMYSDTGTVALDEKRIISEGGTLELDQGYNLTLISTDIDGNQIYIKLTKNGQFADERILETGAHYYFNRSVYGKDQVIISFVLDKIFSAEVNRLAILKDVVQNPDIYADDDDIIPIKKDVVEIWGPIFTGLTNDPHNASTNKVDASNFAGFYYDLKSDCGTESMTVTLDSATSRAVASSNLTYTTTIMDINYLSENLKLAPPVDFQLIGYFGDEYVPIIEYRSNKLSKLLMDDKESHTIRTGQALELGEGYALTPKQIDVDGEKVWLELTKNGEFVDDQVIVGTSPATSANIWVYDQDIAGETDVVTLKIFVKQVFQGIIDEIVVIDGIWQISDSVMEVNPGDEVGKLEVTSVGAASITMDNNDEPITLASGSTQEIANGLSFRVADDNAHRFYLMKSFTEPGIYELRGSIAEDEVFKWTPAKFQGFYYDIDNDIGTESLEILNLDNRVINENNLTYSTTVQEMNFEYSAWKTYDIVGFMAENYFAGYPSTRTFADSAVSMISNEQLSKVLINENKNHSINSGSALILDEGYVLDIIEVDKNGDKVFVSLSKEGSEVDSTIITAGNMYMYTKDLGSASDVPIIAVHFDEIFQETENDGVIVDGIFQISDNCTNLNVGDDYRGMKITSLTSTGITMKNNESIYLRENSIIPIMGNIQFKVADDIDNVRFYPFVEVEIEVEIKPLYIDYFSPVAPVLTSYVGMDQEFKINTNKICNFTWLINGNEIQNNHSALSASYANNAANAGSYNVTVVAETSDEVVQHTWNWTVIVTPPTISAPTTGEIFYFPQNTTFVNGTTIGTNVSVYVNGALVNGSYPVTGGIFNISGVSLVNGMNVINVTAIYNDTVIEHFSENTSVTVSVGQILDVTNDTITLNVPGLPSGIALPFIDLNITGQGNNMPTNISLSVVAAASAPPASNMTGPAIDLSVPGNDSYTFDHPISLTLGFNASSVINFNKTVVAWYNGSTSTWVSLKSTVNTTTNTTTANVTHFTVFAPIEDNTPPANITALTSTGQTTSSITLSWTNSSDTDYIEIWRSNAHITNVSSTSHTNSGLSSSTSYNYALRPVDIVGNKGNWSNVTVSTTSSSSPPSSSGGGGGGGSSGEEYENIEFKDVSRVYISADTDVSFIFSEVGNDIQYINYKALTSAGYISATIEVLKNISTLVEQAPTGMVYKNMNIWVGRYGYATEYNIANPVIGFKIERSWIENNDIVVSSITLCRYHNDGWEHLTTREIGDDEKYIYFGADTSGFSPFAIIGYTEEEMTAQDVGEPTLGLEDTSVASTFKCQS